MVWGSGLLGRLGLGNQQSYTTPKVVQFEQRGSRSSRKRPKIVRIGCGSNHSGAIAGTCATTQCVYAPSCPLLNQPSWAVLRCVHPDNGKIYMWGANMFSQCGGKAVPFRVAPAAMYCPGMDGMTPVDLQGG